MGSIRQHCAAIFLITLITTSAHAATATIFSEDFSDAAPGTYGGGSIPGTKFAVTQANIDIVGVLNGSFFSCVNNPSGNCLDLIGNQSQGQITSTNQISLTAGDVYDVRFGVTSQGLNPPNDALLFSVALGAYRSIFTSTATPTEEDFKFTALSDYSGNLVFTSLNSQDPVHGPVLDNILVTQTSMSAVPLPASAPMFGAALLGLAGLGFKAKRKTAALSDRAQP